jgi:hypothetical protein
VCQEQSTSIITQGWEKIMPCVSEIISSVASFDNSTWWIAAGRCARGGQQGELDSEDVQENELSLVNGFRLLSAYTLTDGTRIWIIAAQ